jgi:hypothetical protein
VTANIDQAETGIDTFHYKSKLETATPLVDNIRISAIGAVGYSMAGNVRINN